MINVSKTFFLGLSFVITFQLFFNVKANEEILQQLGKGYVYLHIPHKILVVSRWPSQQRTLTAILLQTAVIILNHLSHSIHVQILPIDLRTFSYGISLEIMSKNLINANFRYWLFN